MADLKEAKALTITFLTPMSIGSLNGSDKEADNVSSIKKLTRGAKTFPYVSSQALRRALRDQLGLNFKLSGGQAGKEKKDEAATCRSHGLNPFRCAWWGGSSAATRTFPRRRRGTYWRGSDAGALDRR